MSSYRDDGDRIVGYDKEAGGIRTMLKQGMLRSMSARYPAGNSAQKRRAQYMLTGFARNRFMRIQSSSKEASVFFGGRAEQLARIHHFGLRDRVAPGGAEYDYPARELLGISNPMRERISGMIINHLAES
ncbi:MULTISPECIES: phage virion morphogenesis protein [Comamonas]|nr:phage virion morphogenesis protein [Comamonas aquatica]MDE1554073.1 phage virion morphogenesis protein [Comamonas aquatica]